MGALVSHRKYWQKQRTSSTPTAAARYAIVLKVSCVHGRSTMAFRIEDIELGDDTSLLAELVACWRASVEATHTFLTPDDIERIAGLCAGCDCVRRAPGGLPGREWPGRRLYRCRWRYDRDAVHPPVPSRLRAGLTPARPCRKRARRHPRGCKRAERAKPSASTSTTASRCSTARKPTAWATPSPSCICACALLPTGQLDHMARVNHR